jgi:hypothetical protein
VACVAAFAVAAPAAHATLSVPPPTPFTSLPAFEAASGGVDNGTSSGEQASGFRHFNPAGIAVDGSDPGSTAIQGGHTAALSRSRLQPWGIRLGPTVAVANDGFKSVNSHAGFSPANLWAPFNSNTTTLDIVSPGAPAPAVTRGLGIAFVGNGGGTIDYYSGDTLLGEVTAPQGTSSFAGALFRDPVVTRVVVTLGTAEMFGFDGGPPTPGGVDPTTLAAGDDIVLAEPDAGEATIAATAGVPISPVLASFDSDESASQIRATIDWGDGTSSSGSIAPAAGGGFVVTGSHAYAAAGSYTANVTVDDFSGSELTTQALVRVAPRPTATSLTCSPSSVAVTAGTTCTATVSDTGGAGASTPTGLLSFSSTTTGAGFGQDGGCLLAPTAISGVAACAVQFTPGQRLSNQAHLAVAYGGDGAHAASDAAGTVGVRPQRCTLTVLTRRRLRPQGIGVLVTCDARSGVQIGAKAVVARKGRLKAFRLQFGTVHASVGQARPTVLIVKPAHGVIPLLRAALRRHQRISLRLTLTASSQTVSKQTTTRVSAFRLGERRQLSAGDPTRFRIVLT